MKNKKQSIRIIRCLKELKGYFAYRKIVEEFSHSDIWKHFRCKYSSTRKFGFIVRIFPQYIYSKEQEIIPNEKERLVRSFIADYITPFTNALNGIGLFENYLTIQIQQRLGEDEMKMINDFLFYEVEFAYRWKHLKKSYIVLRFFLLIGVVAIIHNFSEIIEILKKIII